MARKTWTKKEEEYMYRWYTLQPVEKTAKQLNRTIVSVKRKASSMGLNSYLDNIGARVIARSFHCDISVILRWIHKLDLPAKKIVCKNQIRYNIDIEKFWKWAETHKHEINWSRYEIGTLLPEPNWVKEEKSNLKTSNHRKRFTDYEKASIKTMLYKGMTYKEIAQATGRTYYSINHLCGKIFS